jgi:hypothetical protein
VYVVSSDINYQPATLRARLLGQVAGRATLHGSPASPDLTGCVRRVAGAGSLVLVERGRYRGSPVTIIVVSGAHGELGWVTGPACSATKSDVITSVVLSPGISAP